LEYFRSPVLNFTYSIISSVIFLGVICTALGYGLWNLVLTKSPAGEMAVTLNLQPLGGIIIGYLWLGETMKWGGYLGTFLILLGVTIILHKPKSDLKNSRI